MGKINDQWLGRELQPYEIASKTMRIGKALAKGYLAADFREALQRYFTRNQADQKSDPPSSNSHLHDISARQAGATSPPATEPGPPRTEEQKKDEPGGTEGGEAAAA